MIRIENPIAVAAIFAVFVACVVVVPFIKTERFRITRSKIFALVIAIGYCVYYGSFMPLLIFAWPLSLIWFPDFWGDFTGYIEGPYIDEKSPPVLVSAFGWFFLIPFPIFVLWIMNL